LPQGHWIDFWRALSYQSGDGSLRLRNATTLDGGRSVAVPAPLDELPLMVRAGAILPLLPPTVQTLSDYGASSTVGLDDVSRDPHLIAFPGGKSESPFGEDGRLLSTEGNDSWTLTIKGAEGAEITLDASLTTMLDPLLPCAVKVDGRPLPREAWSAADGVLR